MKPFFRNFAVSAGLLCTMGGFAHADTTIFSPKAILVPRLSMDVTGYYDGGAGFWRSGSARLGLPGGFEVAFGTSRSTTGSGRQNLDFEYQFLSPIADTSPGIAFGVLDSLNETKTGRRFYAVMSEQIDMGADLSHDLLATVSLGYQAGVKCSPFVGVRIPLGTQIALLAEHDGSTVNAGFEYDPIPNLLLEAISRGQDTLLKVRYRIRF